jgi:plastocyanin
MKSLRALSSALLLASGVLTGHAADSMVQQTHAASGQLYTITIGTDFFYRGFVLNKFFPDKLVVHVGDSVRWLNSQPARPQTVTFGSLLSTPPLFTTAKAVEVNPQVSKPQGGHAILDTTLNTYSSGAFGSAIPGLPASVTYTFPKVGTFFYRSLFHPSSLGEIDVVPANQPASPNPPDTGASYKDALRSVNKLLDQSLPNDRLAGAAGGTSTQVLVGGGDGNASLTFFSPTGLTVKVGSTVTWQITETSGDPHCLVFFYNPLTEFGVPLYTGFARDGGLLTNPAYRTATITSGTTLMTNTYKLGTRFTSGFLYGSSVLYPSPLPSTYTLTFDVPGAYLYEDPFLPGNNQAAINVIP